MYITHLFDIGVSFLVIQLNFNGLSNIPVLKTPTLCVYEFLGKVFILKQSF